MPIASRGRLIAGAVVGAAVQLGIPGTIGVDDRCADLIGLSARPSFSGSPR